MATLQVPQEVPRPIQDSKALRKAFQGWKTDEKAVIQVLSHRNAIQRRRIVETYQELYNQPLIDSIGCKLSGDFGSAVMLWTLEPVERDARLIKQALNSKKLGMNEVGVIIEMSFTSPHHHWKAVQFCYASLFKSLIIQDVNRHVSKSIGPSLLMSLLWLTMACRPSFDPDVNLDSAEIDATRLKEAIESKQLQESDFAMTFGSNTISQLKATLESYHKKYGNHISEDIKDCGDELEYMLKLAVKCIDSPEKHFAEVIKGATRDGVTDQYSIIRVILRRAEIDLQDVRQAYLEMNKTSLDDEVKRNTSGNYQDFLMALMGHRHHVSVGFTMQLNAILKNFLRASRILVYPSCDEDDVCGVDQPCVGKKLQHPSCDGRYLMHGGGFSDGLARDLSESLAWIEDDKKSSTR